MRWRGDTWSGGQDWTAWFGSGRRPEPVKIRPAVPPPDDTDVPAPQPPTLPEWLRTAATAEGGAYLLHEPCSFTEHPRRWHVHAAPNGHVPFPTSQES